LKIAIRTLGVTMALNVLVIAVLIAIGQRERPGMHAVLALTNGIGALLNAAWLYAGLRRANVLYGDPRNRRMVARMVVASAGMAAALWWFSGTLDAWLVASATQRAVWLACLVAGGATIYFGLLWVLGARGHQFRLQPPTVTHVESAPKA
jgi:putative peptidoglycan lipid II flippase